MHALFYSSALDHGHCEVCTCAGQLFCLDCQNWQLGNMNNAGYFYFSSHRFFGDNFYLPLQSFVRSPWSSYLYSFPRDWNNCPVTLSFTSTCANITTALFLLLYIMAVGFYLWQYSHEKLSALTKKVHSDTLVRSTLACLSSSSPLKSDIFSSEQ